MHRFVVVLGLLALLLGGTKEAYADGAWLDEPQPQNWNVAGQSIPAPPRPVNRDEIDARCLRTVRPPENDQDTQIEQQGWLLVGTYTGGWSARFVQGALGFDGMCRPLGYQTFVFFDGVFAGTFSPTTMDARTDGALNTTFVNGPDSAGGPLEILANFARYTPDDALCCPSATSSVSFQVTVQDGKPLVVPMQASTYTNGQP